MDFQLVHFDQLRVQRGFNARLPPYDGIEDEVIPFPSNASPTAQPERKIGLVTEIERDGLRTPLEVRPGHEDDEPVYVIVEGHRRYEALGRLRARSEELAARFAEVPVILSELDDLSADVRNLNSSLSRRDLTTFEVALKCSAIRSAHGLSAAEIAERVGSMTKAYAANLMRAVRNVHGTLPEQRDDRCPGCGDPVDPEADILLAWRQRAPFAPVQRVIEWAVYQHTDQVTFFQAARAGRSLRSHAGNMPGPAIEMPGRVLLKRTDRFLSKRPADSDFDRGMRALHDFYVGRQRVLRNLDGQVIWTRAEKARR